MEDDRLLDYRRLAGRLATAAVLLGAVAFAIIVAQGLQQGLSFRLMGRWVAVYAVAFFVVATVMTAGHALAGARRAQRRGGRLGSDDVGLVPRRRGGRDER